MAGACPGAARRVAAGAGEGRWSSPAGAGVQLLRGSGGSSNSIPARVRRVWKLLQPEMLAALGPEMLAALQPSGKLSAAWLPVWPDPKLVWTAEACWPVQTNNLSQDLGIGGAASRFFFLLILSY